MFVYRIRISFYNITKVKKKKIAWLDTCLLYSAQAELHYSLSDYNVSILLSSYPSWTWDGYAYCALVSGGRVSSWGLPFRLWSLHSRLLTREKNSTASFFHHFRQYSRSISGEGKSRLAGNYEAAVLLRPQSPRDFYGPFQEVVRNRTTVQYHKKKEGEGEEGEEKKYPCGQWWSVTREILRSTLENAEHYKLWWARSNDGWEEKKRRNGFHSRSKEILSQINFNEGWDKREKKLNPTNSSSSVSLAKLCSRIEPDARIPFSPKTKAYAHAWLAFTSHSRDGNGRDVSRKRKPVAGPVSLFSPC